MSNYKIGDNMPEKPKTSGPIIVAMLEELEEINKELLDSLNMAVNIMKAHGIPTDILELTIEKATK